MSVIKISELTEKTTLAGTEDLLINDSGTSKKMKTSLIKNIQTACETAQTAAELAETNAETAETNAAASASAASTSASNAASSASAASSSASSASSSASSASSSASAASSAQSAAESARDATLAAYDSFDDRYLGVKSSAPSLDNDGNALVAGALYFDSTSQKMQIYNGTSWVDAYTTGSSLVAKAGDTMTGNLNFGDNVKAVFGAGSDLQIYHSGTQSFIQDSGTGNLNLLGASRVVIANGDASENMAQFLNDDGVWLYYDNAVKLSTTSTGIDVTGTVTADGLTVENSSFPTLNVNNASGTRVQLEYDTNNAIANLRTTVTAPLVFETANTDRLRIDSNGDISFYEDTGTTAKFFWDASAESLYLGSGGTSTPAANLVINDNATSGFKAKLTSANFNVDGHWLGIGMGYTNGYMKAALIAEAKDGNARANLHLALDSDTGSGNVGLADAKMTVTYDGNVGIGTSSPSTKLSVVSGTNAGISVNDGTVNTILYNTSSANGTIGTTSNHPLAVFTNNTERMRIDSSGNLLVGTTSESTWANTAGHVIRPNSSYTATRNGAQPIIANRLTSDGDIVDFRKDGTTVGSIGNSGTNLTVASAGELRFFTSTSNEDMRLETDGDLHVDGNVIAYSTTISDERLKENIEVVTDATTKLKQIRGVTFTRKDSGEQSAGVIAQEIEKILPQAVKEKVLPLHTGTDDLYKTVEYDALHAVLIEAVKELTARVEQLEKNNG